jgi:hypothetical protein
MAFTYESAVPWGRSFDEYRAMFRLSDVDLKQKILGCADGPAGFNAEATRRGCSVVSCDPLYQLTVKQIDERIAATYEDVIRQTAANQERFIWKHVASVEELGRIRRNAMNEFIADYDRGKREGRYVAAELPGLPFRSTAFDLAICSHCLFLYTDNFSLAFHDQAIQAMCRVAAEVRVFPLLTYNSDYSAYIEPILRRLRETGFDATIETVPYEFQRGANQMMRITRSRSEIA